MGGATRCGVCGGWQVAGHVLFGTGRLRRVERCVTSELRSNGKRLLRLRNEGRTQAAKESKREMRDWLLEKMRRRSRRGPNESESTGKSGQELPSGQLAPLRPTYPEPLRPEPPPPEPARAQAAPREAKPVVSRTAELPVELPPVETPGEAFTPASDGQARWWWRRSRTPWRRRRRAGCSGQEPARLRGADDRAAGLGQDDLVQATGGLPAFERHAADDSVRRYYRPAVSGAGVQRRCGVCCGLD